MKRTAIRRKEPRFDRSEHPQARKAVEPKTCAHCGKPFQPFQSTQRVCATLRCAKGYAATVRKDKELAEKAEWKSRKEAIKPVSEWEDECRKIVQKIARIRDRNDGCISCHMGPNYGGIWHGSHFRSVGACSALQFHLWNIHKACAQCNKYKAGNIAAYRPRLAEKIGEDRVKWLECQNQISHLKGRAYVAYLERFKRVMGKRCRRMEKWAKGMQ